MEYLLGLIGLMVGAVGYLFVKKKSSEALLENNEVKSKLNEQDKNKAKNDGLLLSEEDRRSVTKEEAEARKNNPVDPKDFN